MTVGAATTLSPARFNARINSAPVSRAYCCSGIFGSTFIKNCQLARSRHVATSTCTIQAQGRPVYGRPQCDPRTEVFQDLDVRINHHRVASRAGVRPHIEPRSVRSEHDVVYQVFVDQRHYSRSELSVDPQSPTQSVYASLLVCRSIERTQSTVADAVLMLATKIVERSSLTGELNSAPTICDRSTHLPKRISGS